MNIKEDIAKMLEDVWTDETTGEAYQKQVRGLLSYEINHRVRQIMTRMVDDAVIRDIVRPYINERVKALEPKIKASLDLHTEKILKELSDKIPNLVFEAAQFYSRSWMENAASRLKDNIRNIVDKALNLSTE